MELSKRLQKVADFVTPGNRAADVGCDHGYVPIWLIENGIVPSAIAADVRPGPLGRAQAHIQEHGLEKKIETRLSDGLEKIRPGEVQTLIFSGMGGPLMIRLLSGGEETAKAVGELILSPQSELEQVRRFLVQNGYTIDREAVLEEDEKYYFIFHVIPVRDDRIWTEEEYVYGKDYEPGCGRIAAAFLEREICKKETLLQNLEAASPRGRERTEQIRKESNLAKKRRMQLGIN